MRQTRVTDPGGAREAPPWQGGVQPPTMSSRGAAGRSHELSRSRTRQGVRSAGAAVYIPVRNARVRGGAFAKHRELHDGGSRPRREGPRAIAPDPRGRIGGRDRPPWSSATRICPFIDSSAQATIPTPDTHWSPRVHSHGGARKTFLQARGCQHEVRVGVTLTIQVMDPGRRPWLENQTTEDITTWLKTDAISRTPIRVRSSSRNSRRWLGIRTI